MKITNAIKKLEKIAPVTKNDNGLYTCKITDKENVHFYGQDGDVICIHTMRANEQSDSMTDYFPQTWHDNITQAINFCE